MHNIYNIKINTIYKIRYVGYVQYIWYIQYIRYLKYVQFVRYVQYVQYVGYVRYVQYIRFIRYLQCVKYIRYVQYVWYVRYVWYIWYVRYVRYIGFVRFPWLIKLCLIKNEWAILCCSIKNSINLNFSILILYFSVKVNCGLLLTVNWACHFYCKSLSISLKNCKTYPLNWYYLQQVAIMMLVKTFCGNKISGSC